MKFYFILLLLAILGSIFCKKINEKNYNKLLSQLSIIDKYKNTTFGLQLGANNPCEDSFFIQNITLLNNEGIFFSIFDGHGGYKLSQYANLLLYPYFIESFNIYKFEQNLDKRIKKALKEAYDRIETEFLKIAFNERLKGNTEYSFLGSCALSAIVINKKIFVANLGDSKARLFFLDKNNVKNNGVQKYNVKKVSKVFNIRKKDEQNRMKKKFKNDDDIYRCYGHKACYVKGALQPTRSLGDYTLKYLFFSINDLSNQLLYDQYAQFYQGPYINAKPDIHIYDIEDNHKYLILGSDGLWDVIKSRDMGELIYKFINGKNKNELWNNKKYNDVEKISYGLIHTTLIQYSKELNAKDNYKKILDTPFGKNRRNIHDDITIITCDLSKYN